MAIAVWSSLEQLTDDNLAVLNGGSVTVYLAGTTNLVSLFTNDDLTGATANPIVLDSAGRHGMKYKAAAKYKTLVKNSVGSTISTRDNIDTGVPLGSGVLAIANGGTSASTGPAAITALGGATAAEVAAIAAELATLAGALGSTDDTQIATGSTAQRPSVPTTGMLRWNTTLAGHEWYNGTQWWLKGWGATGSKPGSPGTGDEYFDTTLGTKQIYNGVLSKWLQIGKAPTVQKFTSGTAQTYTATAGTVRQRVRIMGPGAGGGAQATNAGSNGSAATSFQVNAAGTAWTAGPGTGGPNGGAATAGGAGGTGGTDGSTGTLIVRLTGGQGDASTTSTTSKAGRGGTSALGGSAAMSTNTGTTTGANAAANTGGGGGGGGPGPSGGGGGAGEYVEFWVENMATATYTVGTGGIGGVAGTVAGGNGAAGIIIIEEFYS